MDYKSEARKYQRYSSAICDAKASSDRIRWYEIEIRDISAGGICFRAPEARFEKYMSLYVDISVYNMLSEFTMRLGGTVARKHEENGEIIYALTFENMDDRSRVLLDEVINSKMSINKTVENSDGYMGMSSKDRTLKGIRA